MERSQQSSSDENSMTRRSYGQMYSYPPCNCGRAMVLLKSWTDDNPGRRFYKCEGKVNGSKLGCEVFRWADEEKPHGWQKVSLLEARDQIRQQKEEIKKLKEVVRAPSQSFVRETEDSSLLNSDFLVKVEGDKKKFENEAMASKEREKLLRQFILISWGGFVVVTAMILTWGKN